MGVESHEERVIKLLADPQNRTVLSVVEDARRPLELEDLAAAIVSREIDVVPTEEYERRIERTMVTLHHSRLPKLDGAGVVSYDADQRIIDRVDGAGVAGRWLETGRVEELLARIGSTADTDSVGIVEGRQAVIDRGRRLADEADEELFLLYVSTDLLEAECIRRAEAAIDRGVDISLGSADPEVRELARSRLPEVTVWEPQLDLTNAPAQYPRVGRLVLADRETVMLAVLDEPDPDERGSERALVGRGRDNPLVVMVCELLGARIDHLDYQTADFREQLPF